MNRVRNTGYLLTFTALCMLLYGCPRQRYMMYVRNLTTDTAVLRTEFTRDSLYFVTGKRLTQYKDSLLSINRHTKEQLDSNMLFDTGEMTATLKIPPGHTFYITPLLEYPAFYPSKLLTITTGGTTDTLSVQYPYKNIPWSTKKRERITYLTRTIFGYDIK